MYGIRQLIRKRGQKLQAMTRYTFLSLSSLVLVVVVVVSFPLSRLSLFSRSLIPKLREPSVPSHHLHVTTAV